MHISVKSLALILAATSVFAMPMSAFAHKAWIVPSQTVNSGVDPVVTFDAAISNDLFYPNHVAMPVERIAVTAPDGTSVNIESAAKLRHRSVFDVALKQVGTYRIASVSNGYNATWIENGQAKRWRGSDVSVMDEEVPSNATDLKISQTMGRIETFVTNGSPNAVALKPTGKGLELIAKSHPNDLMSGESAQFTLLLDGQPLPNATVEVALGATRYRNALNETLLKTDAQGVLTVSFDQPGMYWLETSHADAKSTSPRATERRVSYVATFEVLPE